MESGVPSTAVLVAFSGASLLVLIVPGPSVVYVVTRSLAQGRRAGLWSALGLETGAALHVAAATIGLAGVLAASDPALTAVRWAGAAYLVWLAVREFSAAGRVRSGTPAAHGPARPLRLVRDGILIDVLNPKTATFFLAFLPQFVVPSHGGVATQFAVLGLVFVTLAGLVDGAYAVLAGRFSPRVRSAGGPGRHLGTAVGGIYLALAGVAVLA
ncbi:LysE family translocator [Nocardioides insulae]|uniref:LysE family translocator n=1 Tax=Nocardioides insulae TaxID=394734 RepID=UPI00048D75F6|nr:LysE family translocator [Nocardioides insulae]